jgi:hypothetical protein
MRLILIGVDVQQVDKFNQTTTQLFDSTWSHSPGRLRVAAGSLRHSFEIAPDPSIQIEVIYERDNNHVELD